MADFPIDMNFDAITLTMGTECFIELSYYNTARSVHREFRLEVGKYWVEGIVEVNPDSTPETKGSLPERITITKTSPGLAVFPNTSQLVSDGDTFIFCLIPEVF